MICFTRCTKNYGNWNVCENKQRSFAINSNLSRDVVFNSWYVYICQCNFYYVCNLIRLGIHPHDAKSYSDESWEDLKSVAANPECVAVGECGLDYNRNFSEPEEQRIVFRKQV